MATLKGLQSPRLKQKNNKDRNIKKHINTEFENWKHKAWVTKDWTIINSTEPENQSTFVSLLRPDWWENTCKKHNNSDPKTNLKVKDHISPLQSMKHLKAITKCLQFYTNTWHVMTESNPWVVKRIKLTRHKVPSLMPWPVVDVAFHYGTMALALSLISVEFLLHLALEINLLGEANLEDIWRSQGSLGEGCFCHLLSHQRIGTTCHRNLYEFILWAWTAVNHANNHSLSWLGMPTRWPQPNLTWLKLPAISSSFQTPSNHHQAHLSSLIETQTLKASIGGSSSWSSSLRANTAAASCRKFSPQISHNTHQSTLQLQHSWCIMTLSFHRALGRFKSGSVAMRRCSRTTRSSGLFGIAYYQPGGLHLLKDLPRVDSLVKSYLVSYFRFIESMRLLCLSVLILRLSHHIPRFYEHSPFWDHLGQQITRASSPLPTIAQNKRRSTIHPSW